MSLFDSVSSAFGAGGSKNPTTFKIKVGGKAIDGIISFQIEYVINRIPVAHISIFDGDVAKQDFERSAMDSIAPGKKVEISIGYESLETTVFKGIVTSQSINLSRAGSTNLQLVCKDPSYKMTMGNFSSYYYKVTDSDIFDEIVSRYSGIKAEVSALSGGAPGGKYPSVVQHNMSDWDFLVSRAQQAGYFIRVSDGTIEATKPKSVGKADLKITLGMDIIDMQLDLSSESIFSEYKAYSWDDESLEMDR
jgi:phage protein D